MVKDRLIFTLLMQHGTYMLSRNFRLQSVGDLQWIREYYDINSILYSTMKKSRADTVRNTVCPPLYQFNHYLLNS